MNPDATTFYDPDDPTAVSRREEVAEHGNAALDLLIVRDGTCACATPTPVPEAAHGDPTSLRTFLAKRLPPSARAMVHYYCYSRTLRRDLVVEATRAEDGGSPGFAAVLVDGLGRAISEDLEHGRLASVWRDSLLRGAAVGVGLADTPEAVERCLAWGREAFEREPDHLRTGLTYADLLRRTGNFKEALDVWDALTKAHPFAPEPFLRIAATLLDVATEQQDDYALAVCDTVTHIAATRNPDHAGTLTMRARFLAQIERFAEARDLLLRAADIAPEDAVVRFNLGVAYFRLNEPSPALSQFQQAAEIDPEDAATFGWVARCHARLGEKTPMESALRTAEGLGLDVAEMAAIRRECLD